MIFLPSLGLFLAATSPLCARYLECIGAGVSEVPTRPGGYDQAPQWLEDALHAAAHYWSEQPRREPASY